MGDVIGFLVHPFTWLWTGLIIGTFMSLQPKYRKMLTTRDNVGIFILVCAIIAFLALKGAINLDEIRRSGPFVNLMRYLAHPLTLIWSAVVIGGIIGLDDEITDDRLNNQRLGYIIVAISVVGILIISVLSIDVGTILTLGIGIAIGFYFGRRGTIERPSLPWNHFMQRARTVNPPQETFRPTVTGETVHSIPVDDDDLLVQTGTEEQSSDEEFIPTDEPR